MIRVVPTRLPEVLIIESPVFSDERGYFTDVFHAPHFADAGLPTAFLQDSHSHSVQHTLRGLHFQLAKPQGKLVRVMSGSVYDVAVDIRRASPTFAQWVGVTLTAGDGRQVYIPPGFAHGFLTLSASADMGYKLTDVYDPSSERSVAWNDPRIAIEWPLPAGVSPRLAPKDTNAPMLSDAEVFP